MEYENNFIDQQFEEISFFDLEDNADFGITKPQQRNYEPQKRSAEDFAVDGYADYSDAEELFEQDELDFLRGEEQREQEEYEQEESQVSTALFDSIPDEAMITVGETSLSKSDLSRLIEANKDVNASYSALSNLSLDLEQKEIELKSFLSANFLECDYKIQEIQRRMNDPMTNSSQRGELYSHLQFYEGRKNNIEAQTKQYEQRIYDSKMNAVKQRYEILNRQMSKEMSDWGEQAPAIKDYALKAGISEQDLHQVASPALVRMIVKAMKHDNSLQSSKDVLKEKAGLSKQRATANSRSKAADVSTKRNKLIKSIESGNADVSDWFSVLED